MKKKLLLFMLLGMLMLSIIHKSYAESSQRMSLNSSYSVTLNGTKKTLKISPLRTSKGYISHYRFYVNGKVITTYKLSFVYPDQKDVPFIQFINLKNKKSFIYLSYAKDTDAQCDFIFMYKNNKFKRVLDLGHLPEATYKQTYSSGFEPYKFQVNPSGNNLEIKYTCFSWNWGSIDFVNTYKCTSSTLKNASATKKSFKLYGEYDEVLTYLKTKKKITVNKSAGGTKVSFTVPKNKVVWIKGFWTKSGKVYLKVRYNTGRLWKTGWLNMKKNDGSYFENIFIE